MYDRNNTSDKNENAIAKAKSVKNFINNNRIDKSIINEYMATVTLVINEINEIFKTVKYCKQPIVISKVTTSNLIQQHI